MNAMSIGECEKGKHLYFPGENVYVVDGLEMCEDCFTSQNLVFTP